MLISVIVATVLAIIALYANKGLNTDATMQRVVHVLIIVLWALYLLDAFTGRHVLGRLGG